MRHLYFLLFIIITFDAVAQQKPQYTQYIFNNYVLNPALAGIENYIDCKAGYRTQWTGLDGAPVTQYFSIQGPIGKDDLTSSVTSFGGQEANPLSRSYVPNYQASDPHHGLGMHAVFDKAGPISRIDVNGTYAYHLGLSAKTNLALGLAVGISAVSLDRNKITLEDEDDLAIPPHLKTHIKPDLSMGLWFYGPLYFVGLSGQQLLRQRASFSNESSQKYQQAKYKNHYFLTAGYKVFLSEGISAIPSVMFKHVSPVPISCDVNVKFSFQDKFWLGGSYRHKDSFSGMLGFYLSNLCNVSYSYDLTLSNLGSVNKGTHEIILGILLDNTYNVVCPQRNW